MKQNYPYGPVAPSLPEEHEALFLHLEVPFSMTREDVWDRVSQRIQERPAPRVVRFPATRILTLAAAVIILLMGTGLVMRYYSVSVDSAQGALVSHTLPGGSSVELNAGSEITYYPLWWRFSRLVNLTGEAYFEVEPGKVFTVRSISGTTTVLGTSFNIYARSDEYRVTCLTGMVRVTSPSREEAVIGPDYQAVVGPNGNIIVSKGESPAASISWTEGRFGFTSVPLRQVLDEIERQYDVRILLNAPDGSRYTGFFSRDLSLEEVLEVVCKPFGLNFARNPEGVIEIKN